MRNSASLFKPKAASKPFQLPAYEPIDRGPKGTWYKSSGDRVQVGAWIPRGVLFYASLASALAVAVFFACVIIFGEEFPQPATMFFVVYGIVQAIPVGFTIYRMGSLRLDFEPEKVTITRDFLILRRKRTFPLSALKRVKLNMQAASLPVEQEGNELDEEYKAENYLGTGLNVSLYVETANEEVLISSDLGLEQTFYLRYVLAKGMKVGTQSLISGV